MNEIVDYDYNKKKLRKITCEWYEENTKKLIKCVKNHQILWDNNHPNHKKKAFRDYEWKLVCNEIFNNDKLVGEVCLKWHSLRSQYISYSKKYKYGPHNKNIKWKYFSMLQFLSSEPEATPFTETTIVKSELDIPSEEKNQTNGEDNVSIESESNSDNDGNLEINYINETGKAAINITNNNKNTQEENFDVNNLTSSSSNFNSMSVCDEYSDFGKFIANELRSLKYASDLQSKLKRQIQRYIVDIADEYALRLNSETPKQIKLESSLSSTSVSTSSSATNYFT